VEERGLESGGKGKPSIPGIWRMKMVRSMVCGWARDISR
jgi:hypothetical protein